MARLCCCRISQKAEIFKIVPENQNIQDEFVLYVESCIKCSRPVLEIIKIDIWNNILKPERLKSKRISKFLESVSVIWKPEKVNYSVQNSGRFSLDYNEYGTKKKCFSNLSSLMLGKIETDPLLDLKNYRQDDRVFLAG